MDIAGLVKGASDGEGMGNEFLSNIAAVDGLYHVCRIFDAEEVTHVEGNVDPIRDLEIIHQELKQKKKHHGQSPKKKRTEVESQNIERN